MVELAALEMLCTGNRTVGSNPTLSATQRLISDLRSSYVEASRATRFVCRTEASHESGLWSGERYIESLVYVAPFSSHKWMTDEEKAAGWRGIQLLLDGGLPTPLDQGTVSP